MEVSGKVLREVEFRDRLRGYDTDEVDEFLEKVAVGVDALRARLEELEARLAAQPKQPEAAPAPAPTMDDDAIRRTLVLAQRTADLAISEAHEEATRLVDEARAEAEAVVGRAEDAARRLRNDAEQELQARVARLGEERDRLERDVRSLGRLVDEERSRLTESLTSTLRYVREALAVSDETAKRVADAPGEAPRPSAPEPSGGWHGEADDEGGPGDAERQPPAQARQARVEQRPVTEAHHEPELPDVEAEVNEDAASAAWAPRNEPGRGHVGTPRPIGSTHAEPAGDGEEALWERWAAGRDLGVVPGPADFGRRPSSARDERDRGWSA